MKIVTLNIRTAARDKWPWNKHFWVRRMREFKRFVKTEQPYVICLQEVTRVQLWCIKRIKGYSTYANSMNHGLFAECQPIMVSNIHRYATIWSRLSVETGKMHDAVKVYILDADGGWTGVMNLHLSLEGEERVKEVRAVTENTRELGIDVICGDFNATREDACFSELSRVREMVMPSNTTFRNFKTGTEAVIDGFLVINGLSGISRCDTMKEWDKISDHYPVMFSFNK